MPAPQLVIAQTHPTLHVDEAALTELVQYVMVGESCSWHYLGIILADRDTVHELNRTFLDHDYPTDVLSFPLSESDQEHLEGEVYVDLDTALERHREFGASFEEEVRRYVIHGLLHLIGYDDATPEERAMMHHLERHYLVSPPNSEMQE